MQYIDQTEWPRRAHYELFSRMRFPFYNVAFPVDVTALYRHVKARGLSFYYALVYQSAAALNGVDAFLYKEREGRILRHDRLVPSFTDMKPGGDLFHIVTLELGPDMADFCARAKAESAAQTALIADHGYPEDELIFMTCLPWMPITTLTNERDLDVTDAVPRLGWGKYEEREGRKILTMSVDVNHRFIDGVHIGRFYQALQARLDGLEA